MSAKKVQGIEAAAEIQKGGLTLLDVFATWCGPCKMLLPIIDDLASTAEGVNILKLDVDEDKEYAKELGVQQIPTVILYKEGKEIERFSGFKPKEFIEELIAKHK